MTVPVYAQRMGVHPDEVRYLFDAGLAPAVVLVPKTALPVPLDGPSDSVCVELPDWRSLAWEQDGADRAAVLVGGPYVAWEVDGDRMQKFTLEDCTGGVVRRSQLVVSLDAQDAIDLRTAPPRINAIERKSFLLVIAGLAMLDGRPKYTIARSVEDELGTMSHDLGRQSIANKIGEALALVPDYKPERV